VHAVPHFLIEITRLTTDAIVLPLERRVEI